MTPWVRVALGVIAVLALFGIVGRMDADIADDLSHENAPNSAITGR